MELGGDVKSPGERRVAVGRVDNGRYFSQQLQIQRDHQACQLSKLALFKQKAEQDFQSAVATVEEAAVKVKACAEDELQHQAARVTAKEEFKELTKLLQQAQMAAREAEAVLQATADKTARESDGKLEVLHGQLASRTSELNAHHARHSQTHAELRSTEDRLAGLVHERQADASARVQGECRRRQGRLEEIKRSQAARCIQRAWRACRKHNMARKRKKKGKKKGRQKTTAANKKR